MSDVKRPPEGHEPHWESCDIAEWGSEWRDYALELERRAQALCDAAGGVTDYISVAREREFESARKALRELMKGGA